MVIKSISYKVCWIEVPIIGTQCFCVDKWLIIRKDVSNKQSLQLVDFWKTLFWMKTLVKFMSSLWSFKKIDKRTFHSNHSVAMWLLITVQTCANESILIDSARHVFFIEKVESLSKELLTHTILWKTITMTKKSLKKSDYWKSYRNSSFKTNFSCLCNTCSTYSNQMFEQIFKCAEVAGDVEHKA